MGKARDMTIKAVRSRRARKAIPRIRMTRRVETGRDGPKVTENSERTESFGAKVGLVLKVARTVLLHGDNVLSSRRFAFVSTSRQVCVCLIFYTVFSPEYHSPATERQVCFCGSILNEWIYYPLEFFRKQSPFGHLLLFPGYTSMNEYSHADSRSAQGLLQFAVSCAQNNRLLIISQEEVGS
jgi:hypothetical protein